MHSLSHQFGHPDTRVPVPPPLPFPLQCGRDCFFCGELRGRVRPCSVLRGRGLAQAPSSVMALCPSPLLCHASQPTVSALRPTPRCATIPVGAGMPAGTTVTSLQKVELTALRNTYALASCNLGSCDTFNILAPTHPACT